MKSRCVSFRKRFSFVWAILLSLVVVGFTGCSDDVDNSATLMEATGIQKSGIITIEPENFIDEFGWYVGFLGNKKEYHVLYNNVTDLFELVEDDLGPLNTTIVCQGDGIGFVRCVRDWLISNPSGCLCICHDNDGYEATDGC